MSDLVVKITKPQSPLLTFGYILWLISIFFGFMTLLDQFDIEFRILFGLYFAVFFLSGSIFIALKLYSDEKSKNKWD